MWCQQERSKAEKELPDYVRDALDRARSGFHPGTGERMTPDQIRAYVNAHLPEGDPGRVNP